MMFHPQLETLLGAISGAQDVAPQREALAAASAAVRRLSASETSSLLEALCQFDPPRQAVRGQWLDAALMPLGELASRMDEGDGAALVPTVARLYEHVGSQCRARRHLLSALAMTPTTSALEELVRLLCEDPPPESLDAGAALAPLFQHPRKDVGEIFPDLLDALEHPSVAPAVLDLANYLVRSGQLRVHPAAAHPEGLVSLLRGVVSRLELLQQGVGESEEQMIQRQQQIGDGVALACSLCDALGLIGSEAATPVLEEAAALMHRRIRVEAAAALARLGSDDGAQMLAAMAEYPITRLRAIAYAEELGLTDHLDAEYLQPTARAEAELVCWLAEPTQLGAAPTSIDLFDTRTQYWPSYDEPQECFLFRFAYETPSAVYANIGIAGPLVHAFYVDLTGLSAENIYAAFAGWQSQHADIHEFAAEDFSPAHQATAARLVAPIGR